MTSTSSSLPTDFIPSGEQELDSGERLLLRRLLLYGFLVRVAVALALELSGFSTRLAPDEDTYGGAGWRTALYWMDEVSLPDWRMFSKQPLGYFYINAAFFYVFGHTAIPLKLVNALLGALTGRYVYFIARDLFGATVAARSAQFAAFFPSLSLTGNLGYASSDLNGLFTDSGLTWSFGPSIDLPIFDWGRRKGNVDVAVARQDIAVASYEATVQQAFREVSTGLAGRQHLAEEVAAQERSATAQRQIARLARIRYREGVADYLEVLDAERNLFTAEQSLISLRRQELDNLAALYAALGGGLPPN